MQKCMLSIVVAGLVVTSCIFGPSRSVKDDEVIARVDGKTITCGELDSLARELGITIADTTDIMSLKNDLLDSLIHAKLIEIREDSVALTLENDRNFIEERNKEVSNTVFRLMFDNEITFKIKLDSAEVDSYYVENPDMFKKAEQVKASHILVKMPVPDTAGVESEAKKQEIIKQNEAETLERAQAILAKAKSGQDWDSLVAKYSQDNANNQKGGALGYFARGRMAASFDSAAFAAEPGEIVGPVQTRYGYHIIKVEDRTPEGIRPLDGDLRNNIKGILFRAKEKERADMFVDSLKSVAKYKFNEDMLSQPDSLLDPDQWVMIINDADTLFEQKVQQNLPRYLRFNKLTEATAEVKKDMLKELAVSYLLIQAGRDLGYYDYPEARQALDDYTRRMARLEVSRIMRDLEYQPSEEEIEQFYNEHFQERYKEKQPLHVQHIIFEDSIMAVIIRDSLIAGADFKEMAMRYYPGEPEIREVAYDLGFISELDMGLNFFAGIDSLEVGEISMPIRTKWGYHIAKLVNRRTDKTLEQVKPGIRRALIEAADGLVKRRLLNQWRATANIKIESNVLKRYKFPKSIRTVETITQG